MEKKQRATVTEVPCVDKDLIDRAAQTVAVLKSKGVRVVTAESCTAGLISAVLSQAEGAGEVLDGSFVVYSKAHKAKALGVDRELLDREGAVNEATAIQMVDGALAHSPADAGLAVTGVLGPDPDEDGNRVGLVFFAVGKRGVASRCERRDYGHHSHDVLRRKVVLDAFEMLDGIIADKKT